MILYAFEIPESPSDRAAWLERMITGLHLSTLVGELRAVHGGDSEQDLSEILGDQLPEVLQRGLGAVSESQLQSLLTHPNCLFELQAQILVHGSSHWQAVSRQQDEVSELLGTGLSRVGTSGGEASAIKPSVASATGKAWYQHPLWVAVATAAVVLLAVNLRERFAAPPQGTELAAAKPWGWQRPGAIKSDVSAVAYLDGLADAAEEWFSQRPASARGIATRIAEFRQGCSTLILSDHQPLDPADRTWLVEKCRAWAAKLDAHLAAAETGQTPITVRDTTDETVRKIISAMRDRAQQLG